MSVVAVSVAATLRNLLAIGSGQIIIIKNMCVRCKHGN